MLELVGDGGPGGAAGRERSESETAGREDEHDEAAIGIEREVTRLVGGLGQWLGESSSVLDWSGHEDSKPVYIGARWRTNEG